MKRHPHSALFRRILILLLALGAPLFSLRSADACKTGGTQCQTNTSCCSGLCVKPTIQHGNAVFGACCTPTTCTAQGKNCGTTSDGCGHTLSCGRCTAPQTCGGGGTPNVCGCTPTTCAAQGVSCGTVSDGCGGTLDCAPPGETLCDAACVDTSTDPNNCGACGHTCSSPTGSVCTNGTCTCPAGETLCGSQCLDLQSDPDSCGSCSNRCNVSPSDCNFCSSGVCQASDLQTDPNNCGSCGTACPTGDVCFNGACCAPATSCAGQECSGAHDNGCGGILQCGCDDLCCSCDNGSNACECLQHCPTDVGDANTTCDEHCLSVAGVHGENIGCVDQSIPCGSQCPNTTCGQDSDCCADVAAICCSEQFCTAGVCTPKQAKGTQCLFSSGCLAGCCCATSSGSPGVCTDPSSCTGGSACN
jgi:hypothetical protein